MSGTRSGAIQRIESGSDFGGFIAFLAAFRTAVAREGLPVMTGPYRNGREQAVDLDEKAAD